MTRRVRKYDTAFSSPGADATVQSFETIGVTPCMAKNLGWYLLSEFLKAHPELPQDGWRMSQHREIHG